MLYSLNFFYLGKFLYVLKRPVIATQPFEINCFAIATEGFKRFKYRITVYFNINLSVIMTTIPLALPLKAKWFQIHREHCFLLNSKSFKFILIRDSLMDGLHRYCKIWNNFFKPIDALNCGIGGDKVQNVLWRVQNLLISSSLKMPSFCAVPTIYNRILQRILLMALLRLDIVLKNDTISLIFLFAGYSLVMNVPL